MAGIDTILISGRIWCGKAEGFAQALSIGDGKVLAVGSQDEILASAQPQTQIIDLGGRLAIPGFNDAHTHFTEIGLALLDIDARPEAVGSIAEIYDLITKKAANSPAGSWIVARGYDPTKTPEMADPSRDALDRAAPDHPVVVARTCGHVVVANSKALSLGGISEDTAEPEGGMFGRDAMGLLNGYLAENARFLVYEAMPKPDLQAYLAAIDAACAILNEQGITSTMDAAVGLSDGWLELEAYRAAHAAGNLSVRITACMIADKTTSLLDRAIDEGLKTGVGDDLLRIGPVKFFTDGAASSGTAAMSQPYLHVPGYGMLCLTQQECNDLARKAHQAGFQLAIHAIGDVAIEQIINAIEMVQTEAPQPDIRHRIEHCGWVRPEQIQRLAENEIIPSPQPNFIYFHGETYIRGMGAERAAKSYPLRRFLDTGLPVPASTDCPTAPLNPFQAIYAMVTRKSWKGSVIGADERITMAEALHAYTYDSAFAAHDEDRKGRLIAGQYADIAVLSQDLFQIAPEAILSTICEMTILGGKVVFTRSA